MARSRLATRATLGRADHGDDQHPFGDSAGHEAAVQKLPCILATEDMVTRLGDLRALGEEPPALKVMDLRSSRLLVAMDPIYVISKRNGQDPVGLGSPTGASGVCQVGDQDDRGRVLLIRQLIHGVPVVPKAKAAPQGYGSQSSGSQTLEMIKQMQEMMKTMPARGVATGARSL